jgi:hypothetical protein
MADSVSLTPEKNEASLSSLGVIWIRGCCLLFFVLLLAGCNRDSFMKPFGYDRASLMKKMTPQDDESLAIRYVDLLRQSRFEQVEDRLDLSLKDGDIRDTLAGMAELFPNREPTSIKTVDVSVVHSRDFSTTNITLEYEFPPSATLANGRTELIPRSWLLAQVVIQNKGDVKTIGGFHVMPISKPVEATNEFTLLDKGISQYAALCLAILVSVVSLYVFVLCIRTNAGKRRWVWLILILIGVCRFTVSWTTGGWFFTLLTVQVPPVMLFSSPYGPWMIHITAPVGAIAFLLLRKEVTSGVVSPPIQSPTLDKEPGGSKVAIDSNPAQEDK